ncbi:MAG: putative lipid II flippase FtsW [Gammaproteobacteria bacterium]|nr:putative lipid II flippase FtsW [Gammaproteobacteria bacterium]
MTARVQIPSFDTPLVMSWLLLLGFGVVMVTSASIAMGDRYFTRHAIYVVFGLATFGMALTIPLKLWQSSYRLAWLAAVVVCVLVLIPGIGHEVNGARRWIDLGPATFQASEAARFLFVIYMAGYLARFHDQLRDDPLILLRPLLAVAVIGVLLLREPDFGSVVVLGASACGLLFLAGARLRHFLLAGALSAGVLLVILFWEPYRVQRMFSFTDPWATAFGSGYQLTQALIAFGRGEVFGLGLGEGIQKLFYLPEAHNDFIFAVIAEELGLVGALLLMGTLAFLVVRILRIGRRAIVLHQPFAGYLCYGVALIVGLQCLINLGVNSGVLPTKGLTLPFVSYGGNSLIVCCAMLGVVCRAQLELSEVRAPAAFHVRKALAVFRVSRKKSRRR